MIIKKLTKRNCKKGIILFNFLSKYITEINIKRTN
jgi:hypothetical protein